MGTGFHSHCHQCHSISLSFVILYFLNYTHISDTLNSIFCSQNLSIIASILNASTRKKCLTSIGSFLASLGFIQPKKQSNLKSNIDILQGVPQLSSHFVLVVCCASHASPIIKWSIYFFSWIKIYAKNGITLKNWF